MPATCTIGLTSSKTVIKGSWVRVKRGCQGAPRRKSRRLVKVCSEMVREDNFVWTHALCTCNEYNALKQRHQVEGPEPTQRGMAGVAKQLRRDDRKVFVHSITPEALVSRYSGAKRREMDAGLESLKQIPHEPHDLKVSMFLKADKYHEPVVKAPRAIQFYNKRHCIEFGKHYMPIEHEVLKWTDCTGTNVCAKGLNQFERANVLRQKWEYFSDPVAVCLDHSKFDSHVSVPLKRQLHNFYMRSNPDEEFAALLRARMTLNGRTRNLTKYSTPGTVASGSMDTGGGNTILNLPMLEDWLVRSGLTYYQYALLADGDDSVIIVDKSNLERLLPLKHFAEYGMETEGEVAYEFEKIDFCQCRPVWTGKAWLLVRNPWRTMCRSGWCLKNQNRKTDDRWIRSVGLCELALNPGIPILQPFAVKLAALGAGSYIVGDRHHAASLMWLKPVHAREFPITEACRESFYNAWGINPMEQVRLEAEMLCSRSDTDEVDFSTYYGSGGQRPQSVSLVSWDTPL